MFYAQFSPYGTTMASSGDELLRFKSRSARDNYVDNEPFDGSNYHRSALTSSDARRWYPNAFKQDATWDKGADVLPFDTYDGRPTGGEYKYI